MSNKIKKRFKTRNKGFTLIELLVVIAVLGLLASILLVALNQARLKARDARRVADFKQISTALEFYYDKFGQYPALTVHVNWTGNWCDDDASCLAQSDQNWDGMVSTLRSAGFIAQNPAPLTWWKKVANYVLPHAFAANGSNFQDPLYPRMRYAYMPSALPLNQNYRLRVKLEDPNSAALHSSIAGKFYWSEDYKSTGPDSCDPSLHFFCTGPAGSYQAFDPGKPVVYLYPTKDQQVNVQIRTLSIDQSIPAYQSDGWTVLAHPNGQLDNLFDGQTYPYLYWEGHSREPVVDRSQGFVVADKDVESFLTDALARQGLNKTEADEFMEYWAPRMHGQPYVYVYFMPQSDYNKLVPMDITPKPDTVIRVYMLFKQLNQPINVTPQVFSPPARKGFTVVEWGGDRKQLR